MARKRNITSEDWNRSLGYSDESLKALNAGKYDQLTGRDPKYTTSEDQVKAAREFPALYGMFDSDAGKAIWESNFARRRKVDTEGARRNYEQSIGHFGRDVRNMREQGYDSSYNDIDFSKLSDFDKEYLDTDLDKWNKVQASLEKQKNYAPDSPGAKFENWKRNNLLGSDEERIANAQVYVDKFGKAREDVLKAYQIYKESQERKSREETPFKAGFKDFKTAPDRGLANAVKRFSNKYFTGSDLEEIGDWLQEKTGVKEVEKQRDYSRNSDKISDLKKAFLDPYFQYGDLASSELAGALLGGGMAMADPAVGFGLSIEPMAGLGTAFKSGTGYGLTAQEKYDELIKQGVDPEKASSMANASGLSMAAAMAAGKAIPSVGADASLATRLLTNGGISGTIMAARQAADQIADMLILGDQSAYNANVKNYMAKGKSEAEAHNAARNDLLASDLGAYLFGLLTGAGSELTKNGISKALSKGVNNADDTLNSVWATQPAIEGESFPRLTGTVDSAQALPGNGQLPALVDNIYPIQMPGTNGVINLPGETAPIQLPDLSAKSAPVSRPMNEAAGWVNPRLVKPLEGAELETAKQTIATNEKRIEGLKTEIESLRNDKSNYYRGNLKKAVEKDITGREKEMKKLIKTNKDLSLQVKGGIKPMLDMLTREQKNLIYDTSGKYDSVFSKVNFAAKFAGDTPEARALAKDVQNAVRKYVNAGSIDEAREALKTAFSKAAELDNMARTVNATYTSGKGNKWDYASAFGDEPGYFGNLEPVSKIYSAEINAAQNVPQTAGASAPVETSVETPQALPVRNVERIENYNNTAYDRSSYDGQTTTIKDIRNSGYTQIQHSKQLTRKDIVSAVRNNIKKYNEQQGIDSDKYLYNDTIGKVIIPNDGIRHGLSRLKDTPATRAQLEALSNLPLYMKDAVLINEAAGRDSNPNAYILAGMYNNGTNNVAVRMVINEGTNELEDISALYALRAKKEGVRGQTASLNVSASTPSELSVADFLDIVKDYYPNEISGKVADYYGIQQGKSDIEGLRYTNYNGGNSGGGNLPPAPLSGGGGGNVPPSNNPNFSLIGDPYTPQEVSPTPPNDVPPTNGGGPNVPPEDGPRNNGPMRERGMSRHMGDQEKMTVDIAQEVKDDFINDPDMYAQLSNKETSERAVKIYNDYPDERETMFRDMLSKHDPASLPLGQMIAKDYSANGNHAAAAQIFRDMGEQLTKAGQFTQASILTMLKNDPLTAEQYAQKSIDKLNTQGRKEFGKKWKDLSLTDEEREAFANIDPGDEEALANLYDQIGQRLGREYPSTVMERLLEGRKVAMLFNMKTILKNFFANPPTLGMRYIADRFESLGQTAVHLIDPKFEKTQSIRSGGTGRKIAKQFTETARYKQLVNGVDEKHTIPDLKSELIHHKQMYKGTAAERFIDNWMGDVFNRISDALYNSGKTKSNPHITTPLKELNSRLYGKDEVQSALETIRNTTYKLLDVTDSPFVKENFVERLGSYLNAQKITSIDDIPDEAIQIAWDEALKATYKDNSWMVKALKGIKGGIEKIPGIGKPLSQGLIPFLQAPGNIGARIFDYSPINGTIGVERVIEGAIKKDHNMIRKGIEQIAKGLTGTGLAYLGMKLYKSGILTGDFSSDDKEKSFQERNGFRPWSLHVGDKYLSFDWMQPFAQTIMSGIIIQQALDNADDFDSDVLRHFGIEGSKAGRFMGAAYESGKAAVNAWFDETPLSDITELFKGNYYDRDIAQNTVDVGGDFFGAMYPATGNALAKTVDTTKRNTKDASNNFSTFVNEQMAKVPFLSKTLPAKYDTWGEEIKFADSIGEAAFQRFAFPGDYSSDSSDPLDIEIQRLFKETNDNRVFPFYAPTKVGNKILNNEESSAYQQDMGQRSKAFAKAFVDSEQYKNMEDADRVEVLNKLYYTSKAITERDLFDKPVSESSDYKKYVNAYDEAGGGEKGVEAVVNFSEAKKAMQSAGLTAQSKLGQEVEEAAKKGDTQKVDKITNAAQSVEDLGFTKPGPKETYLKASDYASKHNISLSLEDFGTTYKAIDANGNQGITQDEIIDYLNLNKVPEVKGQDVWNMYAPKGKMIPYVKEDGTWGKKNPK